MAVDVSGVVREYQDSRRPLVIATVCSHSSLQIFHGARREGLGTLGISVGGDVKFYDAFPLARPDGFLTLGSYAELLDLADDLIAQGVVLVPHGSFVEYLGPENYMNLRIPTFGNRRILEWERDRERQRRWLSEAGVDIPKRFREPGEIDRPVMVKFYGAKGGKGYFLCKNYEEFTEMMEANVFRGGQYQIQEYILGTRYYIHFFRSPVNEGGYTLSQGSLELLGMDRRDEANIDEMYKLGAQEMLRRYGIYPTFVVTGNVPVVIRESLLPEAMRIGELVAEKGIDLFGGIIGPFCIESIVTDELRFRVFEVSTRIVAGTNIYPRGSPYSDYVEEDMSTGRRIAREIITAKKKRMLDHVLT